MTGSARDILAQQIYNTIQHLDMEDAKEDADAILSALEQAGFAIVPVEPTEAMLDGARDWSAEKYGKPIGNDAACGCWQAMLRAAQQESSDV